MKYYLAIDIGASSGRHIIGWKEGDSLKTDEVYRFPNGVSNKDGYLVWDIEGLWNSVKEGLKKAFEKYPEIESLSVDTWGVDYVLLNGEKEILPCISYRDGRTKEAIEWVHERVPFEKLYERTGIQFQPFNTVYQLCDDLNKGRLDLATDFLMIPDYLIYKLTGEKRHEYTNATTTGMLNAISGEFDGDIINALGLPKQLFPKVDGSGSKVGLLKEDIAREVGGQLTVRLCASHDTGSAVEGIPVEGDNPYVSSGTWSLLGIKVDGAITDENSRIANYSNEGGVGYIRYQKNIMGMWVVNNLKKELCQDWSFDKVVKEARDSSFEGVVDVNEERFLAPKSMKAAFDSCFEDNAPVTVGDYFKCAILSLAHGYKKALEELSQNTGKSFCKLYIVGGGAKNSLLNELTEKICNVKVVALPIEATAIGNLKIQMEGKE